MRQQCHPWGIGDGGCEGAGVRGARVCPTILETGGAFSLLSWRPRSAPTQHSRFYRSGRGMARPNILTSIVVAAEWPDPALSLLSWWPRSGPTQHYHFYRGGRGVARPSILTSIFLAAEWPDHAFSLL